MKFMAHFQNKFVRTLKNTLQNKMNKTIDQSI